MFMIPGVLDTAILTAHVGLDAPVEAVEADLANYDGNHIWVAGGADD